MRFGLPTETETVIARRPVAYKVQSAQRNDTNKTIEYLITEALSQLELQTVTRKEENEKKRIGMLQNSFEEFNHQTNQLIDALNENFKVTQATQSSVIDTIVAEEKERKRKEEEMRLKEEQERREEERRKQIAEQKRKEEDERKRLEQKKKEEELALKKKEEERRARLRDAEEKKRTMGLTDFKKLEREVMKWRSHIADIKENVVARIHQNPQVKREMGASRRNITKRFGQLSNSLQQCRVVAQDVVQLIRLVQGDELRYKYLLNAVSKAIISQAETEVTVKATAAQPLAVLVFHLLNTFKELDFFLTARFVKKCCFVLGYSCSIDTEEGRLRMGWKRIENKWEDEVKYEERIGGIISLWAAISLHFRKDEFDLFNIGAQWRFLARILNTDFSLITNVHYLVVSNWWEVAADQLYREYGKQARKLFILLDRVWTPKGISKAFPAATRLQLLVEDLNNGNFNTISPMER